MAEARPYDIVLLGATGFTGGLTADYVAANADAGTRWAVAGRDRVKLERARKRLSEAHPEAGEIGVLEADVTDAGSLRRLAESAGVVATTVGPYIRHGEPLVAACAAAGTDYLDLTGEPEFADRMYISHHERARETGARLIHACGFDSIPHDLGALFAVEQLPEGVPLSVRGFVTANGTFSAGTFHSAVLGFSRPRQNLEAAKQRKRIEQRPQGRKIRGVRERPWREPAIDGAWALPLPTIDPQIVLRSARALERYGPDFSYGHYAAVRRLPVAVGAAGGIAGLFALAQIPPARRMLLGRMASGEGPSEARREKGWFRVRFVGEGGGQRVVCDVTGGDPGYTETAKMLACSALCLAHDELPATSGQVTTAEAMGAALTGRLKRAGIGFEVVEGAAAR